MPNQFDPSLAYAVQAAACGPAAAVAFARYLGHDPSLAEVVDLSRAVGWTEAAGMGGGENSSGAVTNRQMYEALLSLHEEIADTRTEIRVGLARLPCTSCRGDIEELRADIVRMEGIAKPKVNWKGVSVYATVLAGMLGLDKLYDMVSAWWRAYESAPK